MKKYLSTLLPFITMLVASCSHQPKNTPAESKEQVKDSPKYQGYIDSVKSGDNKKVVKNVFYYRFALGSVQYPISPQDFLYFKDDSTCIENGKEFTYGYDKATQEINIEKSEVQGGDELFFILTGDKVYKIFSASYSYESLSVFYNLSKFKTKSNFALVRMQQLSDGHIQPDIANGQVYILKEQDSKLTEALNTYLTKEVEKLNYPIDWLDNMIGSCNTMIATNPERATKDDLAELATYQTGLDTIKTLRIQIKKGNYKFTNSESNPYLQIADKVEIFKQLQGGLNTLWYKIKGIPQPQ